MTTSPVERFRTGNITLGVIGLGYVGLPLCVEAAGSGLRVLGFDVSRHVVEGINAGRSHIQDVQSGSAAELRRRGLLEATTDMARLADCDAISICVPTPLSKTRDPDVSFIIAATDCVAAMLQPGQLVLLESTTYPGTIREIMLPALESTGLKVGEDFYLCFSPERVDPGNPTWNTKNTPKVIGGVTATCSRAGAALYGRFIDTVVPVSSAEAAELTKILENTFRAVHIGLVNETAIIADRLGVDVWEVVDAAATKPFGFMKFTPGPGLGGHCRLPRPLRAGPEGGRAGAHLGSPHRRDTGRGRRGGGGHGPYRVGLRAYRPPLAGRGGHKERGIPRGGQRRLQRPREPVDREGMTP